MTGLVREFWFLSRDRAAHVWLAVAFLAASLAVMFGLNEVASQRATIERLIAADQAEREISIHDHRDWGSAAYYTFHLTYDPPSNFAFAALGQRDAAPWKHKIRMLALEGQIHETDAANPDFALLGRFDYAFVSAMLAPLLVIVLLHDVRARERAHGRLALLEATSSAGQLWLQRASLRMAGLAMALLVPLWIGAIVAGTSAGVVAIASATIIAHLAFWWAVTAWMNTKAWTAPVNLTALIGLWLAFAVAGPAAVKASVDAAIPIPAGGEILLTQREAVNDAWDLPKQATMIPFVEHHPDLAPYTQIEAAFEWKWYYAFQQVGDQTVEPLSTAYRDGRRRRDRLAATLAWLSPPARVERTLQHAARTDAHAVALYEDKVRAFHAQLRAYYYPLMFPELPFTDDAIAARPNYMAHQTTPAP